MPRNCAENTFFDEEAPKVPCRPFLKWVGGKTQLLPQLLSRIPTTFGRYFEPFVGGGALFFSLQPNQARVSDTNEELINTYRVIQQNVEALIRHLQKHVYDKDHYYQVRNVDRLPSFRSWPLAKRAARIIYLNKTCFNGLYRVNSKGHFNVPFGLYNNPTILDARNLRACSRVLQEVEIDCDGFDSIITRATENDFVYFDPPYVPISTTSYFTSYGKDGFNSDMQKALLDTCRALDKKGVKFMLSNSSAPFVLDLYKNFRIELVDASRAINSVGSKRGKISEVIVRNY